MLTFINHLQHRLLTWLHPLKWLAWPMLALGAFSFPATLILAAWRPDLNEHQLLLIWLLGLVMALTGIVLFISRTTPPAKKGIIGCCKMIWETFIFWAWLGCLVLVLSLLLKITSLKGGA